ncbi:McHr [Kingella potus]|uniref:McHr n=1 Tax=Kingella potus TaxID=265175 RepID=A0A377QZU8_9NEIS|nr:bacteriohemerythrin [Kingella potus]UOP00865.1 bacteriohemerythrin [Kingella potus]STR00512.1 McHr [Kingella potus]
MSEPFLHWTSDLDTGIEQVDEQHKILVQYINEMHDAHVAGNREAVGQALDHLIEYTVQHFSDEEDLLKMAEYPLVDAHHRVHENFVNKVQTYKGRFDNGDDVSQELLDILETWLFMHIRRNDHGYVRHVKEKLGL